MYESVKKNLPKQVTIGGLIKFAHIHGVQWTFFLILRAKLIFGQVRSKLMLIFKYRVIVIFYALEVN